jgi:hypothetical protein
MTEERMDNMVHETLESGGSITQAKGNDQELIVTLMSSKRSLSNVFSCICIWWYLERRLSLVKY